jgi:hypothetical protein
MIMTFAPDGRLISCQRKLDGRLKNPVTNFSSECPDDQMLHSAPEVEALPGHVDMVVFESRFTIGNPAAVPTPDGEILFARQVLKLNVGAEGKLRSCQVVENSGPDSDADACAAMPNVYFPRTGSDGKAFAFTATVTRSVYMHVEQVTH